MKNTRAILQTFVALFCVISCAYAENFAIKLDSRKWELGYSAKDDKRGIQEFVLKGETVNNWTELVTLQAFFGMQKTTTVDEMVSGMMKGLKEGCPEVEFNVLNKGDKDALFEWKIENCKGQEDQYEIDRIISGDEAIWILHYATKKLPVSGDDRDKWIKLLTDSKLI